MVSAQPVACAGHIGVVEPAPFLDMSEHVQLRFCIDIRQSSPLTPLRTAAVLIVFNKLGVDGLHCSIAAWRVK
jgi:hypothetical protein